METLRQYFLSVTAAAIICGAATGLLQKKSGAYELVKLTAGLFLALTAIRPLAQIELTDLSEFSLDHSLAASSAAAMGEDLAADAMADIIKSQSEAYILDKAEALGLDVEVEVSISTEGSPLPAAVHIHGKISPYAKAQLEAVLTEEFGIPKEDQQWTG